MKHEIEIEFKQLVNKTQFDLLLKKYNITSQDFKLQTNYYIDTNDFQVSQNKMALRIREIDNTYTLTLKVKSDNYTTNEYHYPLSESQFKHQTFNIKEIISKTNVNYADLHIICALKTNRASISSDHYQLFFDINEYAGLIDYEIEMEVTSTKDKHYFEKILQSINVSPTPSLPKIARAFAQIKK